MLHLFVFPVLAFGSFGNSLSFGIANTNYNNDYEAIYSLEHMAAEIKGYYCSQVVVWFDFEQGTACHCLL